MRLPGMVALLNNSSFEDFVIAINSDVELTHSHPEAVHIALIYAIMLRNAINGFSAEEIYQWGKNNCTKSPLVTTIYDAVENGSNKFV